MLPRSHGGRPHRGKLVHCRRRAALRAGLTVGSYPCEENLKEARQLMGRFDRTRLHSAIGYIAPLDFMDGKAKQIWSERDRKLEEARELRRQRRVNKVVA